jgi:hypothetical protein
VIPLEIFGNDQVKIVLIKEIPVIRVYLQLMCDIASKESSMLETD